MQHLSLLDLGFLITETKASPKHVGGLQIFKRPKGARSGFAQRLYRELLQASEVKAPYNQLIHLAPGALPQWRAAPSVALDQHLFLHALPRGQGDRKALYALVAELHEPLLDRRRPLWEMHLIDGLADGGFAVYLKMHHACADGVTMVRWVAQALSDSPDDRRLRPVWTIDHGGQRTRARGGSGQRLQAVGAQLLGAGRHALGVARLGAMLLLEGGRLTKNAVALPFVATPRTPLTGKATPGRQFASAMLPMARVDALRRRTRATLNHVALTCLDGALRHYLAELGVELKRPVVIQMPVNLRREGDRNAGNKIGIVLVELSPPTDDPYLRLRNVGYSLRGVRTMIDSVEPAAIETYTVLTQALATAADLLGLHALLPPMGNTLVSNVPGPKQPLYLKGAELLEMLPVSTLPAGNLLNITLFSYAGQLFFCLVATDELPDLQLLAGYVDRAFTELEAAVHGAA